MFPEDISFSISLYPGRQDLILLRQVYTRLLQRFSDCVKPMPEHYGYPIRLAQLVPPSQISLTACADTISRQLHQFSSWFGQSDYTSRIRFRVMKPVRIRNCVYLALEPASDLDQSLLAQLEQSLREIHPRRFPRPAIPFCWLEKPFPEGSRATLTEILEPLTGREFVASLVSLTMEIQAGQNDLDTISSCFLEDMPPPVIDIHTHLLPRLDDGSDSYETTRQLVLSAQSQGVTSIFLTPHSEYLSGDPQDLESRFRLLKGDLQHAFPDIRFFLGCEVMCCDFLLTGVLEGLEKGRIPSMNGTRYVLVEFPTDIRLEEMQRCLSALIQKNWKPIMAHAERYACLCLVSEIRELRKMGCTFQVNIFSLEELQDADLQSRARTMIREKLVTFLGTDTHNLAFRRPCIDKGMEWLKENCDRPYLEAITHSNAIRLLDISPAE